MPQQPYGGQTGASGGDPRGRMQNQSDYQRKRYEQQQGPLAAAMAHNYGRGSESNYGDYTDIMNQYRSIASGGGGGGSDGGGGGGDAGGGYSAFHVSPGRAGYSDPFKSYGGMEEFSKTGGYSANDIANMRSRGTSPVRAAYANAEQQLSRGRALQGGYSPNAAAAAAKMAREQSQAGADAMQGVEAGLAEAVNRGRQFGLTGMSGIEGQRLGADVDVSKFNTDIDFRGQTYNADADTRAQEQNNAAAQAAASRGAASNAQSMQDRLAALHGMTNLYGTTPAMSQMFGDQAIAITGQGGAFGNNLYQNDIRAQTLPGQFDQTMGRIGQVSQAAGNIMNPIMEYMGSRNKRPQYSTPTMSVNRQAAGYRPTGAGVNIRPPQGGYSQYNTPPMQTGGSQYQYPTGGNNYGYSI